MESRDVATFVDWPSAPAGYRVDADWRDHAIIPVEETVAPTQGWRIVCLVVTLAVVVASLVVAAVPSATVSMLILVAAAMIGMPHGALDILAGPLLALRSASPAKVAGFAAAYLGCAVAFAAGWFLAPPIGVAAFFAMSWFHFGAGEASGDREGWTLVRVAHAVSAGGIAIAVPFALHAQRVEPMVNALLFGKVSLSQELITLLGCGGSALATVGLMIAVDLAAPAERLRVTVELLALAALFALADPLVSFGVYFCVWHAPQHTRRVLSQLPSGLPKTSSRLVVVVTTLLPVAVAAYVVMAHGSANLPSSAVVYQAVFVTLGALTAPHLVITSVWERRTRSKR